MAGHFVTLLQGLMERPEAALGTLPLLTAGERRQIEEEWNRTEEVVEGLCVQQLFEAQAERRGGAVALVCGGERLTYGELNERANQLAHYLRANDVGVETRVGLCCTRSVELVIGMLGILKAGGVYVPLDASYPEERLQWMVQDSGAVMVLTQEDLASHFLYVASTVVLDEDWESIGRYSGENPEVRVGPENLAYLIYTSGSTGEPKGVAVEQGSIVRLAGEKRSFRVGERDVCCLLSSVTFDASTFEIWVGLLNGAQVSIYGGFTPSLEELGNFIEREGVSTLWLTAGLFEQMVDSQLERLGGVRQLLTGGDVVSPHHVRAVVGRRGECAVINGYGPTENTVFTTCHRMQGEVGEVGEMERTPIGKPIAGTTVYVLDEEMMMVPVGVAGELYTGGRGVARGYFGQAAATGEKFVPNPFAGEGEEGLRLYRTGDRVRWNPRGELEFLGRLDQQVKVRGYRIEPGEIEAVLVEEEGVEQAVVVVREEQGDKRLVGYVRGKRGAVLDGAELRERLRERLPEYMVPVAVVVVEEMPLTSNGKIDRQRLPEPEYGKAGGGSRGARTPVEEILCGIYAEVLGVERVEVEDSFFDLGGHSLLATQAISRIQSLFGTELPLYDIFEAPTVEGLARRVEQALREGVSGEELPPMVRVSREGRLPLSFAQQRLWFLHQLEPESIAYNIPAVLLITGKLDSDVLQRSLAEIVRRHEVLRTSLPVVHSDPIQRIAAPHPVPLPLIDLVGREQREEQAREIASAEAVRPFDLLRGTLFRASLIRLESEKHLLLFTLHHCVIDGWSVKILIREFTAIYDAFTQGNPSPLPDLTLQYADFASWQRQWLAGAILEKYVSYWRRKLADVPMLQLRIGKEGSEMQTEQGRTDTYDLPTDAVKALQELSRARCGTLFMTLLAAFEILLQRYSGQVDFAVGTPIAGRDRMEIEQMIGFFVNMLPLRADLDGNPEFEELLGRVRTTVLEAYTHQALPFERLVEELNPPRIDGRPQIFQVIFTIEDDDYVHLPGGFEVLEASTTEGVIRFGLVLRIAPSASGWCASWRYNTSLFDAKEIERMQSDFATLLEQIAAHPTARINELELSEKWRPSNIAGREQAAAHAARIHFSAPKRAQAAHDNN
ncbi:MAG: hypothetical protein DMG65_26440 [Candidatus Angelobacter sp. Gp1-AA117]|nr:MAG: hypothetical protein DMG65_26440 [Candidatus Angelobacter sp. Gp1-AA117]